MTQDKSIRLWYGMHDGHEHEVVLCRAPSGLMVQISLLTGSRSLELTDSEFRSLLRGESIARPEVGCRLNCDIEDDTIRLIVLAEPPMKFEMSGRKLEVLAKSIGFAG